MKKINIKKVYKSFENSKVLRGVSLSVEPGESHIILGRSGCGKSVLMKCLLGLMNIDSGDILVDSISVLDKQRTIDYKSKFSILFQGGALFDSMTILENVEFGIKQVKRNAVECRSLAEDKILAVGLEPNVFNLYPAEISGGMQKRAALARAIAIEPEIVLFDEPTSGLDPITAGITCNLLKDIVQTLGVTAITITHDLRVAEFLGDKVSVLNNGSVAWSGNPGEMSKCGHEFVENFYIASNIISRK